MMKNILILIAAILFSITTVLAENTTISVSKGNIANEIMFTRSPKHNANYNPQKKHRQRVRATKQLNKKFHKQLKHDKKTSQKK